MMPVVRNIDQIDCFNPDFESIGYECMGELGIPGRRFFKKGGYYRTHHIHIFEQSTHHDIERHLAVKSYLYAHPAMACSYEELKKKLAICFRYDREGYCDGKDPFMKELETLALQWVDTLHESDRY